MGLLELTSELAWGAGNPIGSSTGNNLGSSLAPKTVDYFPNIHATGFTLNFGGPPTLFTMNGVPEVVDTNPIGRHTAGIEPMLFTNSDISLFNSGVWLWLLKNTLVKMICWLIQTVANKMNRD